MTLDFNAKDGFTLMEVLVSLTIISLILGVAATAVRKPSPILELERQVSAILTETTEARLRAIRAQESQNWSGPFGCEEPEALAHFYADGTASGPDLCLEIDGHRARLHIDGLVGRYFREEVE